MQRNNRKRLVVDVNIWISRLLKPKFHARTIHARTRVFFEPENLVLVSEKLFNELNDAVSKPHLEKEIDRADYEKLVALLRTVAELVHVHFVVEICRDPKDNYLLALAKDGNADYLITGDTDLQVLKEFENTKIVDLSEFENVFLENRV
jgi:putative PIN family toxin of toxin-antitoxin system